MCPISPRKRSIVGRANKNTKKVTLNRKKANFIKKRSKEYIILFNHNKRMAIN